VTKKCAPTYNLGSTEFSDVRQTSKPIVSVGRLQLSKKWLVIHEERFGNQAFRAFIKQSNKKANKKGATEKNT